MARQQILQLAIDDFLQQLTVSGLIEGNAAHADQCMEMLAQYLIHYSDLFLDLDMSDDSEYADWEDNLEQHMTNLLEGDVEPASDLGQLPLSALDSDHLRDFLCWFAVRETSNADLIQAYAETLHEWIEFVYARDWLDQSKHLDFIEVLAEVTPDAVRVATLSRVLFHFVRTGSAVSPRLRGKRFSRFIEGHGRVARCDDGAFYLNFENQDSDIGPVFLPQALLQLLEIGDVFDVELGLRGDVWMIVDIGPVYPACVYVEAEEYQGLDKLS